MSTLGRRALVGMVIIALVALATGCDGSVDANTRALKVVRVQGTPVVADALSNAGTALGDGFTVPNGARLVGAVLPDDPFTGYPGITAKRGWTALLLVQGHIEAVQEIFLRQAARKGMQPKDRCDCVGSTATMSSYQLPVQSLRFQVSPRASLMAVTFRDLDPGVRSAPVTPDPAKLRHTGRNLQQLRLPRVGDRLPLSPNESIHFVPGSQALAPSFCDGCFGDDFLLMRAAPGGGAFNRYVAATKQLDAWEGEGPPVVQTRGSWHVRIYRASNTDTGVTFELFQRSGSPDYIRLELGNGA